MMRPVPAMTAFFPTEEVHRPRSRFMGRRWSGGVHDGLSRSYRLRRLVQLLPLGAGQRDLDDPLEPGATELTGHAAEHVAEAELPLQPGRARQDPALVEGDGL